MPRCGMGILLGNALQQKSPGAEVVQIHSGEQDRLMRTHWKLDQVCANQSILWV